MQRPYNIPQSPCHYISTEQGRCMQRPYNTIGTISYLTNQIFSV